MFLIIKRQRLLKMFYKVGSISCLFIVWTFILVKAQDSTLTKLRRTYLSKEHYENGVHFFNQQSYEKAIIEFEIALSLNALDHMTYYLNGLSYERENNLEKALLNYNQSISIKSDFSEALFNRALLLYKLSRYKEAIADFEQLLLLPAGETQAVYFRGIKYGSDDKDARFDEVISMTKKDADVYNYIGLCYYKLDLYDQSRMNFSEALQRNPNDDNIHVNAGLNYLEMGKTDSAKMHFQRSLSINPYNSVAQLNLTLCQPESVNDQIKILNQLINQNKNFTMAYAQRAYQYYLTGNYANAISDYDTAIMLDPENQQYYLERGILYIKINEPDLAISDFNSALDLDNRDFQVWYNLANAYFLKNEYQISIDYYSQAIYLNPDMADLYYNRSLAFFHLKDTESACKDMVISLSLGNKNASQFIHKNCQ